MGSGAAVMTGPHEEKGQNVIGFDA